MTRWVRRHTTVAEVGQPDAMELIGELERIFASSIYPNRGPVAALLVVAFVVLAIVAQRRGWFAAARRHPGRTAAASVLALAVLGPIAWYLGSPLFISTTVDEPPPVAAAPSPSAAAAGSPSTPVGPATTGPATTERSGSFHGADEFHFGEGTARLIETAPGEFSIRLEDFRVRNGPDLFVYLSPSAEGYADGALEVAPLKADTGNQNYELPPGTDVSSFRSVVIWCKQFSVLFATATLG